jgi:hypothetical protein
LLLKQARSSSILNGPRAPMTSQRSVAGVRAEGAQGPELLWRDFVQVLQRLFAQREQRALEGG